MHIFAAAFIVCLQGVSSQPTGLLCSVKHIVLSALQHWRICWTLSFFAMKCSRSWNSVDCTVYNLNLARHNYDIDWWCVVVWCREWSFWFRHSSLLPMHTSCQCFMLVSFYFHLVSLIYSLFNCVNTFVMLISFISSILQHWADKCFLYQYNAYKPCEHTSGVC